MSTHVRSSIYKSYFRIFLSHLPHDKTVASVSGEDTNEPRHEISNNVVCATSKASDQPAHMRSLIRPFATGSRLKNLRVVSN